MNLAIDYGNSRIKAGLFEKATLIEHTSVQTHEGLTEWIGARVIENIIVSSVARPAEEILNSLNCTGKKISLHQSLPLPVYIKYTTPQTLGVDRIAAACGALELLPNQPRLVIDLGTCINYEFVDENVDYLGGAISPGVKMRAEAMHHFTARLPLISQWENAPLIGDTTEACMQSGVLHGVLAEIEGIMARYREKYPTVGVILCGGDAHLFENKLKQPIFVAPNLVLRGLNRILLHNANF